MSESCPVCFEMPNDLGTAYNATSTLFKNLRLAKCINCELVFSVPRLDDSSLTAYNMNYFQNAHSQASLNRAELGYFSAIAFYRIRYIESYIDPLAVKNILEIGPGRGDFATRWINRNLPNKYCAVESDATCHENLRKIGVELCDLSQLISKFQHAKFDLIVMSHVLEHMPEPLVYLRQLSGLLSKDGAIFIEVPCLDYLYKDNYEPHLFFYDKKPLKKLLENSGFSVVSIDYFGEIISQISSNAILKKLINIFYKILIRLRLYSLLIKDHDPNGLTAYQYIISKPFKASVRQEYPSRWIRLIAKLKNE